MERLKKISRIVWIACGVLFISLIVFVEVNVGLVCKDVREVTSQMTIDDVRQFLDIVENQQHINTEVRD